MWRNVFRGVYVLQLNRAHERSVVIVLPVFESRVFQDFQKAERRRLSARLC